MLFFFVEFVKFNLSSHESGKPKRKKNFNFKYNVLRVSLVKIYYSHKTTKNKH